MVEKVGLTDTIMTRSKKMTVIALHSVATRKHQDDFTQEDLRAAFDAYTRKHHGGKVLAGYAACFRQMKRFQRQDGLKGCELDRAMLNWARSRV